MKVRFFLRAAIALGLSYFGVVAQAGGPVGSGAQPIHVSGDGGYGAGYYPQSCVSDGGACADYGAAAGCGAASAGCGNFFFAANGLLMTRDNDDNQFLSFRETDGEPLLFSRDAEMDWSGGFEARFGMYFNGGRNAIEAVYWGLFPGGQSASVTAADVGSALNTPFTFDSLVIDPLGANTPVVNVFNGAERHYVRRSFDVHNIEVNMLGLAGFGGAALGGGGCAAGGGGGGCGDACGCCTCGCAPSCGGVAFTWLMGPRFFTFDESYLFATDAVDTVFTGTPEEIAHEIDIDNNLIGFQIGGRADIYMNQRMSLYAGVKMGVYGNDIRQHQVIWTGDGQIAAVNDPLSPFDGEIFDITSSKTDVSLMGEIDLGMAYRFSNCWSANLGYRAIGVSGIALATSQIPRDFWDNMATVRDIESNGDLILHGGYAGLTFNY